MEYVPLLQARQQLTGNKNQSLTTSTGYTPISQAHAQVVIQNKAKPKPTVKLPVKSNVPTVKPTTVKPSSQPNVLQSGIDFLSNIGKAEYGAIQKVAHTPIVGQVLQGAKDFVTQAPSYIKAAIKEPATTGAGVGEAAITFGGEIAGLVQKGLTSQSLIGVGTQGIKAPPVPDRWDIGKQAKALKELDNEKLKTMGVDKQKAFEVGRFIGAIIPYTLTGELAGATLGSKVLVPTAEKFAPKAIKLIPTINNAIGMVGVGQLEYDKNVDQSRVDRLKNDLVMIGLFETGGFLAKGLTKVSKNAISKLASKAEIEIKGEKGADINVLEQEVKEVKALIKKDTKQNAGTVLTNNVVKASDEEIQAINNKFKPAKINLEENIVNPIDRTLPQTEKVKVLTKLSTENEPIVKDLLKKIDEKLGTTSKTSFKTSESIINKANRPSIKANKPWFDVEHVRDSFRFKTVLNDIQDVPKIFDELKKSGVEIVKTDTQKMIKPKEWGWRFVAFDLKMPNGQLVEYYAPLKELEFAKKDANHLLFEKWRNKTPEELKNNYKEYVKDILESRRRYNIGWEDYLKRTGLTPSEAAASWSKIEASLSSTGSKLSLRSSGVGGVASDQLPSTRIAEKESQATQTLSESGSRETKKPGDDAVIKPPSKGIIPQKGSGEQQPVGSGKLRESQAYKRLVDHLETENPEAFAKLSEQEVKYHRVNLQDQAEKAISLIEKDPQKAFNIAKGYESPPNGMLQRPLQLALADRAQAEKNFKLMADLESSGSLQQTRRGQEIVVDRGRFNDNSPHKYLQQLLDERLRRLGKTSLTETIDTVRQKLGNKVSSAKASAVAKIDKATLQLQKELKKRQIKIQSAQSILDALVCK